MICFGDSPAIMLAAMCSLLALAGPAAADCVDINVAPPAELSRIVHIDAARAAEAVALREQHPFGDVRDLDRIRGIGPARLIDIEAQALACVDGKTTAGGRSLPEIAGPAQIIDGDTIDIGDERIRLIGIDAPEDNQVCLDGSRQNWACGDFATSTLVELVQERQVRCEVYGRDRYQRALAACYSDTLSLNGEMVRSGAALAWYPDSAAVVGPTYVAEQTEAEIADAGMWIGEFTPPWEWRSTH